MPFQNIFTLFCSIIKNTNNHVHSNQANIPDLRLKKIC